MGCVELVIAGQIEARHDHLPAMPSRTTIPMITFERYKFDLRIAHTAGRRRWLHLGRDRWLP